MQDEVIARFWNRVDRTGECWLWNGARNSDGYGNLNVDGRTTKAHRFAWELAYGSIPAGIGVLHRCDNPPCVRVSHLFLGTQAVNMRDAADKGRIGHDGVRGEASHFAKLTSAQIIEIRRRYGRRGKTGLSQYALAREYGVSRATIGLIVTRVRWAHVE